ncbi:MAG: amylo-alpha-1,6-glucosidase, partial [Acidimicrobiales bacterium]
MPGSWTAAGSGDRLVMVEGAAFLVSAPSGEVAPGRAEGFFFRELRFLSRWELLVNGVAPDALALSSPDPYRATLVSQVAPAGGRGDATLLVLRHRYVGRGMREDLVIRNLAEEPAYCAVEIAYGADFADVHAVRSGHGLPDATSEATVRDGALVFARRHGGHRRELRVTVPAPVTLDGELASFEAVIPARGEWSCCQEFVCVLDDVAVEPRWPSGQPVSRAKPAERLAAWRRSVPVVETDHAGLRNVVASGAEDLGALRIFDPEHPQRTVVAAGAPWSMRLFGRDSLVTSWMALLVDPDLALGTLQTLARFQGSKVDPLTEEEPGCILHELRTGDGPSLVLGARPSYGAADTTPLFVMLLGELRRWGLASEAVEELLPNAERALEWIERFGDADGDGYVEYHRATDRGLANQGWKDSWDGIRYADGRVAQAPIALCEVQAYVYSAYLARAHFAKEQGDEATYDAYRTKAGRLKTDFNRDFWNDKHEWFAVGLDAEKRQIDSLTSNVGHCLWTGIVDEEKAPVVAERLLSDAMFSGWGLRTLASTMGGYNPISYHCGSV